MTGRWRMSMKFGIRERMLLLVGVALVFIGVVVAFFVYEASDSKDKMIARVGDLMLEEAKDKIQVATNNMVTSIGGVIKTSGGTNIVDSIRTLITDVRFEEDKSGYFLSSRTRPIRSCRPIRRARERTVVTRRTPMASISCGS